MDGGNRKPLPHAAAVSPSSRRRRAEPTCSIFRDPRRLDHDLDAVAPDEVFTVRTYATRRDYEPPLSAQIPRTTDKPTAHNATAEPIPPQ